MKNCSLDAPVMPVAFAGDDGGKTVKTLTVPGRWTIETRYIANKSITTAYVVIPKISGARRYAVHLTKPTPDVAGGVMFPVWRDFTPTILGEWQDREGAYWHVLAGSDADAALVKNGAATLRSQFQELLVTVTITF